MKGSETVDNPCYGSSPDMSLGRREVEVLSADGQKDRARDVLTRPRWGRCAGGHRSYLSLGQVRTEGTVSSGWSGVVGRDGG